VADGSEMMAKRIERVLTNDPGIGIARHADAGYEEATRFAKQNAVRIPMKDS
jgi:urocanate hydratase